MYTISYRFSYYLIKMEGSQALLKFKAKAKALLKAKAKAKATETNQEIIIPNMCISQLEYDWYSRLCPNFNKTTLRIITEK